MSYVVYVHGCCKSNGDSLKAQGGYGVWFSDEKNESGTLPFDHHTNQKAALYAIQRALEITSDNKGPLLIRTDSRYAINQMNWRERTKEIWELVKTIRRLRKKRVKFQFVSGHSGDNGIERAAELANDGAKRTRA